MLVHAALKAKQHPVVTDLTGVGQRHGTGRQLTHRAPGRYSHAFPATRRDGNRIGLISDLVMTQELDGLLAIVGVGGFLGFGTRDVAIPKDRIAVTEDKSGELRFTVASTREQLQQAPVFDRTALVR